ncbi:MAG TPA: glycosyltransferase family 4 protein [Pyrinomonadaceae bacterium]
MRILQISSARSFGGGERHFVDLANALAERGHHLHLAVIPNSPLISHLRNLDQQNICTLPLRNALDLQSAWKLRKSVQTHQIEIIHAHVARDYPLAALAVGRSSRAQLVLTRHVLFPLSSVHRLTKRRVTRVIAVSQAVADNLHVQNIFDEAQISIIRHGIDLSRFPARSKSASTGANRPLRVGMLGEISPVKGQEDFVRAAAIIAPQTNHVKFVIAGRDNSADGTYRRAIEALVHELALVDRVDLVDQVDDVPQFLSELDVFVSGARSEAFGLAIVEAMACGVPVVATMTAGAREIIEDNQTGRLVPLHDAAEMARVIGELLGDPGQRESLAANARREVNENFSLERMVNETEQLYRDISGG